MKNKRVFISLLASFLLVIISISTAFATFYFAAHNDETQVSTRLDDIEENYSVSDSSLKADNYYDVYFFAQPLAADTLNYNKETKKLDYKPVSEVAQLGSRSISPLEYGYWPSDTIDDTEEIDKQQVSISPIDYKLNYEYVDNYPKDDTPVYLGYKHLRVYQSITTRQFNSIGNPATAGVDRSNWPNSNPGNSGHVDFSGWTANQKIASDYAIKYRNDTGTVYGGGQGNFDYVNAFSSLEVLDQSDADGSDIDDNTIFLYPIFTTGKDYVNTSDYRTVARLETRKADGSKEIRYFSQIRYEENRGWLQSKISYDIFNITNVVVEDMTNFSSFLSVAPAEGSTGWNKDWLTLDTFNGTELIFYPGIYNIHLYFVYDEDSDSVNAANSAADNLNGIFVNNFNGYLKTSSGWFGQQHQSQYYRIMIERVYEFHMLGGAGGINSFDYNATSAEHMYQLDNGYTTVSNDLFSATYFASNIFIGDSLNSFNSTGVLEGRSQANVFTISAAESLHPFTISAFEQNDSLLVATDGGGDYSTIGSSSDLLQLAVPGDDYSLTRANDSEELPTMLKVKDSGYYDFIFRITFRKPNGETSGDASDFTNYVENIEIGIRSAANTVFIKIYDQNLTAVSEETGFIDHSAVANYSNVSISLGATLNTIDFGGQTFEILQATLKANNKVIKDHVTQEVVDGSMRVMKNYIFYIASAT